MNQSHVSSTALPEVGAAPPEEPTRLPEEGPAGAARPSRPEVVARPSGWSAGRITGLVIGVLLLLVSLVLLGGGGTGVWADLTQRDAGYVTTGVHKFSTSGAALATEPTHLGSPGVEWLYSPGLLGKVRIRVTPVGAGSALFVGIGRSTDVDRYLAGVHRTLITDFFGTKVKAIEGGSLRAAPGTQRFWVAASAGPGTRTLLWKPTKGSWTVAVMNADARHGIAVEADLGARFPAVLWIAIGLLIAGLISLAGGGLLVAGAFRGRRAGRASTV